MLADLTPEQRDLAAYMSALSEEAYSAAWMSGLEYALWEATLGGRPSYGRLTVEDHHRARLRQLSEACGGWIVFEDRNDERWVSLHDWEQQFLAWKKAPSSKTIDG